MLRTTDILWTKPSELSFYTALGLPIIMTPPLGSQEEFNRKWLLTIASGTDQLKMCAILTSGFMTGWIQAGLLKQPWKALWRRQNLELIIFKK